MKVHDQLTSCRGHWRGQCHVSSPGQRYRPCMVVTKSLIIDRFPINSDVGSGPEHNISINHVIYYDSPLHSISFARVNTHRYNRK